MVRSKHRWCGADYIVDTRIYKLFVCVEPDKALDFWSLLVVVLPDLVAKFVESVREYVSESNDLYAVCSLEYILYSS